MQNEIVVYIPSESKVAQRISTRRLLGVPQFLRVILTLEDAGHMNFTLIAPISERRQILKAWEHHAGSRKIKPHFVWTPNNQRVDQKIFDDILKNSTDTITLINANLLVTKDVLTPWEKIRLREGQNLKAVIDRGLPPITRFQLADLKRAGEVLKKGPVQFEDIIRILLAKTISHPASDKWNEPVKLITRFTKRREGTKFLTEKIRLSTPQWIARNINKRISLPISVVLAKLRVSPNTITAFNMLIGMAASIGAAGRTYVGLLIGAILFQTASIVDGCDGEVAKLTHRCTKFGQYIDSISDNLALLGFITGLMIHVYRVNNHTPMAFVLGGILLVGIIILLVVMTRFLKKNTDSASFVTFDKEYLQKLPDTYPKPILLLIKYGKYTLKKDFFSFMFLIFAIIGILPLTFYLSIFGVWVGIGVLAYLNFRPQTILGTKAKK